LSFFRIWNLIRILNKFEKRVQTRKKSWIRYIAILRCAWCTSASWQVLIVNCLFVGLFSLFHCSRFFKFFFDNAFCFLQGTFRCGLCGKVLSCQGSFNRHRLVHTENKPYKCRFCPSAFREAGKRVKLTSYL
jgi:hypothetical protein